MLTKGAIGNLVNRYRAVLKKCNLINTFGSLAVASMLVLGGAGVASAATSYQEGKGEAVIADSKDRILGGWNVKQNTAQDVADVVSFIGNVTMNEGTTADMVLGGHYVSGDKKDFSNITLDISSTSVTINGGTVTSAVIGGTGSTDASGLTHVGSNVSNLTINGGTFGQNYPSNDNCLKIFVTGGDLMKQTGPNRESGTLEQGHMIGAKSHIKTVNTTITGGTFDAIILGGSVAAQYYGGPVTDKGVQATVGTANLTINGGTFNRPISAGGVAWGHYAIATVDTANLVIDGSNDNLEINSDIYSGGVLGTLGAASHRDATVGTSNVTIKNATVKNVYGTHSEMDGGDWSHKKTDCAVNTNLTLVNVTAEKVDIPLGKIELRAEGAEGGINITSAVLGDDVSVSATADGALNDSVGGNIEKAKEAFKFGEYTIATVKLEEGLIAGEVIKNADGSITKKVNTVLADTLEQATAAPLAVNRILMNDVRKRMGDLRSDKNESGVWMRWDGGKLAGDGGLTNNFNTLQIGGDTKVAKNCRFGVAGSFTHGDIDQNNGGGELETYTFAAYGTWMAENGMFADVIARVGFTNAELQVKGSTADIDNEALSLSAEYGWRLPVCDQFFLEPQVELTYTHVTGADFTIKTAKYDIDSVDSVIGRAGLVAGWNLPNDRGNLYARASVVHEFLGDSKISATNNGGYAAHELDGDDTWVEYGIGANVKLTDKTYIWADVERTEGAELDEEWRGTVGIRYSF